MSSPPLVSVIIPCRNGAAWLGDAIESCLAQTWQRLEVIVVDDASTDDSRDVARRYWDRGVVALDSPRRGASAARNAGLQRASGDFVQFLDADDLLDRDKIRIQIERLGDAPAGAVASGAWARFSRQPSEAVFAAEPVWRDFSPPEEFLIASWLGGGMMANFAWLTPRALIEQAGPWDETLSLVDDGEYFCRVLLVASAVLFCGQARGFYRSIAAPRLSGRRDRAAFLSAFTAIDLSCRRLLERDNSRNAKKACATQYQRFAYGTYPDARDLVARAERRAGELGGSELQPGGGRAFQLLAKSFGWKFGRSCQRAWRRLQEAMTVAPRKLTKVHELRAHPSLTAKQAFGKWLVAKLPFNEHVFNHFRLELNAILVRALHYVHPAYRTVVSQLRKQRAIKLNIGCGPFGHAGWVNLDLYANPSVTIRFDCRRRLPLANGSCRAIHCEHFFEHLDHGDECAEFLNECFRCLEDGGILRIVVPDGELFVRAYLSEGWSGFRQIAAEGNCPENDFATKMEALNHVFVQGYEHYGAYDTETLSRVLQAAGFRKVTRQSFGTGSFPGGCIDRPQHRRYSLYIEAEK